jgi:mycofactocin biosynthetic radical S-adenosylmethionine protein MftC
MGSISPCTFLGKEFIADKWVPGKLADIWLNSEKFKEIRNLPENDECSQCDRHNTCHSECPAMRLHVGGSLDAADPGCIKPLVQFLGNTISVRKKNV